MLHFWKESQILNLSNQKMALIGFVFPKLQTPKTWLDKCLKSPVSEEPTRSKMVNVSKHCQKKFFFLYFLLHFWNVDWTFKIFQKNMTLTYFELPELRTPETWSDKCLKSHVLEDPSTSIMVNVPNHFGNLHYSIFTLLIEHF